MKHFSPNWLALLIVTFALEENYEQFNQDAAGFAAQRVLGLVCSSCTQVLPSSPLKMTTNTGLG
jgi:hypothetical protein